MGIDEAVTVISVGMAIEQGQREYAHSKGEYYGGYVPTAKFWTALGVVMELLDKAKKVESLYNVSRV